MTDRSIAYFTMEIHLDDEIPTYSGGLGVLAGDTIRSAADLELPMVAVSLLYRRGYFRQALDAEGNQVEQEPSWRPEDRLEELSARVTVGVEGRELTLRCYRFDVEGVSGHTVPVYLLDTDLDSNSAWDREITQRLYGGDEWYRLCQEIVLGRGGARMLQALGHREIKRYHMNEGHAALLTLDLLAQETESAGRQKIIAGDITRVRERCVFTTHTPVPAGHDQFPLALVERALGPRSYVIDQQDDFCVDVRSRILQAEIPVDWDLETAEGVRLNMTYLALNLSGYVNGVAKKHGEISRLMFAGYPIDSITNGVHVATWAAPAMQDLFDRYLPGWRSDNFILRNALAIDVQEIKAARRSAKAALVEAVAERTGVTLDPEVFTIGFARRCATYKRATLLLYDLDALRSLSRAHGGLQIVYAGKAHPRDAPGKQLIREIVAAARALAPEVTLVFVPDYDASFGKLITSGVDLWLNTPLPPNEASGTSGMKAALNGVPNLSTLDGWWIEGCIEGLTGWSIGDDESAREDAADARAIYEKLDGQILPAYHDTPDEWARIMRHSIAINGSFFNTTRMLQQYVVRAYV